MSCNELCEMYCIRTLLEHVFHLKLFKILLTLCIYTYDSYNMVLGEI